MTAATTRSTASGDNDLLYPGAGRDDTYGGAGHDAVLDNLGRDHVNGGSGYDYAQSCDVERRIPRAGSTA